MDVQYACSFTKCSLGPVSDCSTGRVEVKTFALPKSQRTGLVISWSDSGEALFHIECWNKIMRQMNGIRHSPDSEAKKSSLTPLEIDMLLEARKTAEFHDSQINLAREAKRVSEMLQSSKFAMAFTGAGISTSAGIGDFRGKSGKWTEQDRKKTHGAAAMPTKRSFTYEELRPTYTHEALSKLCEMGFIKHIISQNCDGLHRLSGIPAEKLSELHGNCFDEKCEKCEMRYERPYAVRTIHSGPGAVPCPTCRCNHRTGKKCKKPGCNGYLMNTVINFGDNLEDNILTKAFDVSRASDLVLSLGTTLKVSPANSMVTMGQPPIRLVICNRQKTPCDDVCNETDPTTGISFGARVFGDCDILMKEIMRNILPPEDLHKWENDRQHRLAVYAKNRSSGS